MAKRDPLCCCEVKAMLAELRRRARNGGRARARGTRAAGPLAGVPTRTLVRTVRDRERAVYGTDDRKDLFQVTDRTLAAVADSVVALVKARDLTAGANGTFRLATTRYRDDYDLCASEPFGTQPLGCFCSGFLVAPDVVATAGHCVRTAASLRRVRFVFGFRMLDRRRARTTFAAADVYAGAELLDTREEDSGADWALVRLDRPVVGRAPLRIRTDGKVPDGRSLFVVGHPNGLPAKLADGARVRDNRRRAYFVANLDTYGGNSGSPVFDRRTRVVEGILVRGETDFVPADGCQVSKVCPDTGCQGEDVTRSTIWASRIP